MYFRNQWAFELLSLSRCSVPIQAFRTALDQLVVENAIGIEAFTPLEGLNDED